MQIEELQYSDASDCDEYPLQYSDQQIYYVEETLDMDDSQFIIKDSSNMSFLSEGYIETIWIKQNVCQPIVSKAISDAIASSSRSETVQSVDNQSPSKILRKIEKPNSAITD